MAHADLESVSFRTQRSQAARRPQWSSCSADHAPVHRAIRRPSCVLASLDRREPLHAAGHAPCVRASGSSRASTQPSDPASPRIGRPSGLLRAAGARADIRRAGFITPLLSRSTRDPRLSRRRSRFVPRADVAPQPHWFINQAVVVENRRAMDATIQALLDYVGSKLADAEALMAEMFLGEDADS